ncbi:MAG: DNA-binding response regulator MtrA [Candidatus Accumulibacter appositus]|uniref:DNA-binding response regulator MtrA n=1 Tax=Candidatus Accumulibacter appositus TaxID=1454003 RepID=A0A011PNV2_9PROT|nr:response regulator [Accumulibacter sp.]EXI78707.1 MAG: DNA-binding response regulator MtrA [Candidatus Accumulibacter appositus]HRF03366.1 response regulator [Accumulibacter sp.]
MSASLQRILYVEDEVDIRTVAKLALEAVGGFEVEVAASGDEALLRVREFVPDLLLLDVMMPGMDGPATLRALRAQLETECVPAIFMTARALPGEVAALKAEGALGVITKPFDPMALADRVRMLWEARDA